jgi:hypothetical protein
LRSCWTPDCQLGLGDILNRLHLSAALVLTLLWLPIVAWAAIAIDGTPVDSNINGNNTSITVTLTTPSSLDIIDIFVTTNGGASGYPGVSSISSSNTTGWSQRASVTSGSSHVLQEWQGKAAAPLSSEVITINLNLTSTFTTASAIAITGANQTTIFDSNGALPATASSGNVAITTSNANDIVLAGYAFANNTTPSAGGGWTQLLGANYMLVEYQIVSTTQSSLSATIGTGDGDENNGIGDAIMQAAAAVCQRQLRGVGC